jgi:CheY-like chemotaxis protein
MPTQAEAQPETESQPATHILLVEENPITRSNTTSILNVGDYVVKEAESAEAALKLLEVDSLPNLILISYRLSETAGKINGLQLAQAIRNHENQAINTLPIALTSKLSQEEIEEKYPSVFDHLLLKYLSLTDNIKEKLDFIAEILKEQT